MLIYLKNKIGMRLRTCGKLIKEDMTIVPKLQNKTITESGTYGADDGYAGLGEVTVDIHNEPAPEITSEDKTVTPSEEMQVIKPELADYLGTVTVEPIPEEYVKIDDDDIVTFDKNGTYDVGHKRTAVVAVSQTSGECTRPHVIEVDELPTGNIDRNAIYKAANHKVFAQLIEVVNGEITILDVWKMTYAKTKPAENEILECVVITGGVMLSVYYIEDEDNLFMYGPWGGEERHWDTLDNVFLKNFVAAITDQSQVGEDGVYAIIRNDSGHYFRNELSFSDVVIVDVEDLAPLVLLLTAFGTTATANTIPTKTSDGILTTVPDECYHFYYIEDENYGEGDVFFYMDGEWVTVWDVFGAPNNGKITNIHDTTEYGGYILMSEVWDKYVHVDGTTTISEPGSYNVTTLDTVVVNNPIVGIWEFPENVTGLTLNENVNFTWENDSGEIIEGVGLQFVSKGVLQVVKKDGTTTSASTYGTWYGSRDFNFGAEPQFISGEVKRWLTTYANPVYTISRVTE